MANKQISQLTTKPVPVASTDQFGIDDNSSDSYKITVAMLQTYFNAIYLALAGGTMTGNLILAGDPSSNLMAATKQYVDAVATGLNIQPSCRAATTTALTVTYNNGSSGVGATLTNAGAQAALVLDGVTMAVNDRVLVKDQAAQAQNGIYVVTNIGSGASNWVMTRATDYDTPTEITPGDFVLVVEGTANGQSQWVQTSTVVTVGTTAIVWQQFSADVTQVVINIQNSAYVYSEDTGAANAYVATLTPALVSYVEGTLVILDVANANTGASTINVNGLGVKNIVTEQNGTLQAGDLIAGRRAWLLYDGTSFRLVNRNIEKRIQNESFNYILDTGAANAYVATLVPAVSSYVAGLRVSLKIANTNTGASTVNVNGLGATSIVHQDGSAVVPGDLFAGMVADLRYDGSNFQLLNPYFPQVFRAPNIIIGGDFALNPWQRGTSFVSPTTSYVADRWQWLINGGGAVTIAQTTDAPTVAQASYYTSKCYHVDCTTADASIGAAEYYTSQYNVEGYDIAGAGFGQTSPKYITLSFWHKHTKTGTYTVAFQNSAADRSYVMEYTQSVSDTWEFVSKTIQADASGTWLYTNGAGLRIYFNIAMGSNYNTSANAWTAGNLLSTSNQVNGMDNTANDFKLALIKLELGNAATLYPIESRQNVLSKCQRYYMKTYSQGVNPATNTAAGCKTINCTVNNDASIGTYFPVDMCAVPTVAIYSKTGTGGSVTNYTTGADAGTTVVASNIGTSGFLNVTSAAGLAAGTEYYCHYTAQAELG